MACTVLHMFYILLDYNSSLSRSTSIHPSIALFFPVRNDLWSLEGLNKYRFLFDDFCCYQFLSFFFVCSLFCFRNSFFSQIIHPDHSFSSLHSSPFPSPHPCSRYTLPPPIRKRTGLQEPSKHNERKYNTKQKPSH